MYSLSIKCFQILSRVKSVKQIIQCPVSALLTLTVQAAALDPDELCTLMWGCSPRSRSSPVPLLFYKGKKKKRLPLDFHNSPDA